MEKAVVRVLILLVVLALAVSFLSFTLIAKNLVQAQEESVKTYSYTKAVCNSANYCQDYHIICNSNGMIEMNLITGAAVQFPPGWQDPRSEDAGNNFCG